MNAFIHQTRRRGRPAISPISAFLSPVSVNLQVSGVSGVSALIHKGFLLKPHDFPEVSGVSASAGYVLKPLFAVFIHTERFNFIQIPYESIQPPRRYFCFGAGAGQQFSRHAKLSFMRGHHAAARCCDRVRVGAEKHHGLGSSNNWRNSRALHRTAAFQFLTPSCAGRMASFMAGRVGAFARMRRFQLPVCQPHTVCRPYLAVRGQFLDCSTGAIMADNRITAPASGTLGNSPAINNTADTRTRHAKATAYACGFLALLIFIVNAWLVIEGIQSTEPASEARYAHIAQSVLLALIEFSFFAISGLFPEFKNSFRAIGIVILLLEIGLMSISQISTGLTAGKVAARSDDVVAQLKSKVDMSMNQVKVEQDTAKNLNGSKHGWRHEQAAQQSTLAGTHAKSATSDIEAFQKASTVGAAVSTPMVEIIGKTGLAALSIALAFGLSISGIALTHCMGSLIRRSGVMPVDLQILELLQRIHGAPAAPVQAAEIVALAPVQSVAPVAVAPALASFKPAGTVAPKDITTGLSYSSKAMMAGAGLLAATAAPMAHSAPAVPAAAPVNVDIPSPINVDIPAPMKTGVSAPVNDDVLTSPEPVNVDIPSPVNVDIPAAPKKARKPRVVRDGAVMDSGLTEHDGARYRRALAGVKSGKLRPSIAGLAAGVDASAPVARRYLAAMADAGVIVPSGRGFALVKKGGQA